MSSCLNRINNINERKLQLSVDASASLILFNLFLNDSLKTKIISLSDNKSSWYNIESVLFRKVYDPATLTIKLF